MGTLYMEAINCSAEHDVAESGLLQADKQQEPPR